jgi:hypothetical protein
MRHRHGKHSHLCEKTPQNSMGFSLIEVSISPSHDWQARTSPAIEARETRRSYAQCTRHTGDDLVSIALIGSALRLNGAASIISGR